MARKDTAKLVAAVNRRKSAASASSVSNKFNQSQSKYARKAEESSVLDGSDVQARIDRMRRRSGGVATDAHLGPAHVSSRQIKANAFALHDAAVAGKRRRPEFNVDEQLGNVLGSSVAVNDGDQTTDEPSSKQKKHERFEELISDTRRARVQNRREREERDLAMSELDKEFSQVSHLLQKRDKRQEQYDAFVKSGTKEVRALLEAHQARKGNTPRELVIGKTSSPTVLAEMGRPDGSSALDEEDRALLAKLTSRGNKSTAAPAAAASTTASAKTKLPDSAPQSLHLPGPPPLLGNTTTTAAAAAAAEDVDDFDRLMGTLRLEMRKAHASDRTLTEEEAAEEQQRAEKLREQRSRTERVSTEVEQLTNKELLERGGHVVYRMDGDALDGSDSDRDYDYDNDGSSSSEGDNDDHHEGDDDHAGASKAAAKATKKLRDDHPLDLLFAKLEKVCKQSASSGTMLQEIAEKIHEVCKQHPKHAVDTFRLILLEGNRLLGKGRPQSNMTTATFLIATQVFPLTDYRHPVITPLTLLLTSILTHARLNTLQDVHRALVHCSLLIHVLLAGRKFAGEPLALLLNVLGLMVPLATLQPRAHEASACPFPLAQRSCEALLGLDACAKGESSQKNMPVFCPEGAAPAHPTVLLETCYTLLLTFLDALGANPGVPALVDVFEQFHSIVAGQVPPSVQEVHLACLEKLRELALSAKAKRTPLAMRTFRPAPLRQFDPQLVEAMDDAKRELQDLKKDMREERKRVVRHVQAEAAVERRTREREQQSDETRRAENLKKLMAELQQQQHVMKTVDMFRNKAKSKKRKGLSGAAGHQGEEQDGAAAASEE